MRWMKLCLPIAAILSATCAPAAASPHPSPELRQGTPQQAGFIARYINELPTTAYQGTRTQSYGHPAYPGAAFLAARNGIVAASRATGFAVRYASPSDELSRQEWISAEYGFTLTCPFAFSYHSS